MAPAQGRPHESDSLGSWVLTRQIFHFILIYTFAPVSPLYQSLSSLKFYGPWKRDFLFPFCLPGGLSAPPSQIIFNTFSGLYKWMEPFDYQKRPPHEPEQGPNTTLCLAGVIVWLVLEKREYIQLAQFLN